MGNCVSCTEGSSSREQAELRVVSDGSSKTADHQASGSPAGVVGMHHRTDYVSAYGVDQGPSATVSNGSRTPVGSSAHHITADGLPSTGSGQKAEKKNFYSRIPPLGRSGSTDKKSSSVSSNAASIKDNNNQLQYSETLISTVYEQYKDSREDAVLAEGIERMCRDLELKPEDFKVLVVAWKFGAEQMCRFSREEFFNGMREFKVDSMKGIQGRLPEVVAETLADPNKFKDLYRFAFKFGLDSEIGQRILGVDMAVSLWKVVFSQREPAILSRWISFLEKHPSHIRGIPRDTWNMFLNFVETVGSDMSSYDDTEAWPSLFDDFVEHENDRLNENVITMVSNHGRGESGSVDRGKSNFKNESMHTHSSSSVNTSSGIEKYNQESHPSKSKVNRP